MGKSLFGIGYHELVYKGKEMSLERRMSSRCKGCFSGIEFGKEKGEDTEF